MGDLDKAVEILQQFIAARDRSGQLQDSDYAVFLFNLACYKNLKAQILEEENQPEKAEELRKRAWSDLKRSCQLDPESKKEVLEKMDEDLASLFNLTTRTKESL